MNVNSVELEDRGEKLFQPEQASFAAAASESSDESKPLTILTNRQNLIEILTSGLIKPANCYEKYYEDLGARCPNGVPLVHGFPAEKLVEMTIEDSSASFPVVIEVGLDGFEGRIDAVDREYQLTATALPIHESMNYAIINGVVPSDAIVGVYFRSEQDLSEFSARSFLNLQDNKVPYHVDVTRFQGPRTAYTKILRTLSEWNGKDLDKVVRTIDRIAGATLLATTVSINTPQASLAFSSQLLRSLELNKSPAVCEIPEAVDTLAREMGDHLCTILERIQVGIVSGEDADHTKYQPSSNSAEVLLARIVAAQLITYSPEEFVPDRFLAVISDEFRKDSALLELAATERYTKILKQMSAIIKNLADSDEFPLEESLLTSGLLLFLQRREPDRIINGPGADTIQVHGDALTVAAVLSGLLYGAARLPATHRGTPDLERYVFRCGARVINSTTEYATPPSSPVHDMTKESIGGRSYESLSLDGVELVATVAEQAVAEDEPTREEGPKRDAASAEAVVSGPINKEVVMKRLLNENLQSEPAHGVAIAVCRSLGWNSCVRTAISLQHKPFYLTNHEHLEHAELRVAGFVEPQVQLREQEFRKQFEKLDLRELPDDLAAEIDKGLSL